MSDVVNRTTKQYFKSVNTPDFPAADWIINPDLTALIGVPSKYWNISGDTITEMSQAEKDQVDADEQASAIVDENHLATFDPNTATFPATAPAAASSRNRHPLIAYDDTTDENVIFHGMMSQNYSAGSLTVDLTWLAASATTGDVKWDVAFERMDAGGLNWDVDSFAAVQTVTSTTNADNKIATKTSITFTRAQADAIAASDAFRLKVTRDTSVAGNMVGDAQLGMVQIRQ